MGARCVTELADENVQESDGINCERYVNRWAVKRLDVMPPSAWDENQITRDEREVGDDLIRTLALTELTGRMWNRFTEERPAFASAELYDQDVVSIPMRAEASAFRLRQIQVSRCVPMKEGPEPFAEEKNSLVAAVPAVDGQSRAVRPNGPFNGTRPYHGPGSPASINDRPEESGCRRSCSSNDPHRLRCQFPSSN
ncbi:hypothetical protein GCM10022225_83210 [Plantactinospora mayteni]|uniref:Uncharacterized protein n=1 Tax=Plantactinospora mayteni TaxID=566021 RepID=A0ABQ4F4J4_9ACTN|nr:hypothetical protein Pma05_83770 [Plantactinospora mayteni]